MFNYLIPQKRKIFSIDNVRLIWANQKRVQLPFKINARHGHNGHEENHPPSKRIYNMQIVHVTYLFREKKPNDQKLLMPLMFAILRE